jgi:hypothetical protein
VTNADEAADPLQYALRKMSLKIQAPFDPTLCENPQAKAIANKKVNGITVGALYAYTTDFTGNDLIKWHRYDDLSPGDRFWLAAAGLNKKK